MSFRQLIPCALLIANASQLQAQINPFAFNSDARPRNAAGSIFTDAFADGTGVLTSNVRTFGWQFQTIPGDPYFLQEPGFNATNSSGLPGGSALGFDVTRGLSYWNGSEPINFTAPPPTGEALALNFASGTVTINGGSAAQPGFNFVTLNSSGAAHRHLNAYLNNGATPTPAEGVYLTSVRLTNTGGVSASRALYFLFGNGVATAETQRALSYVANPLKGDANFSSRVDIADFSILAANFNQPGEKFWYDADFNDDLVVNIGDFSLLASNFNLSAPVGLPRGAVVPEPTLLAGAAPLLLLARRRRIN